MATLKLFPSFLRRRDGGTHAEEKQKGDEITAPTTEIVLEALKKVQDPEIHRDIVSLGMVKNLAVNDGKVSFTV
ncbi:MAG: iron-sulfur cluster assembly protein, partial [Candidatus Binatia bacterium]